ncbi:hypothetical protein [Vagococcus hydrophili]|uniref:Uncharacterized protein n=1 Tax=Vagococcus hydrophili TaxID=2714947 RepID=A0A6G8AUW6_9ENTE|nr:hypothetical protein [Vagococcus hydrophili]QIL48858.1 hypothetical protein G7082_10230 [Vagococcus hydrophili]
MISKNIKRVLKILPIIAMAPVVIANSPWKHSEKEKTPKKIKTEQITKIKEDTPT